MAVKNVSISSDTTGIAKNGKMAAVRNADFFIGWLPSSRGTKIGEVSRLRPHVAIVDCWLAIFILKDTGIARLMMGRHGPTYSARAYRRSDAEIVS